jgi:hypothetical protein
LGEVGEGSGRKANINKHKQKKNEIQKSDEMERTHADEQRGGLVISIKPHRTHRR